MNPSSQPISLLPTSVAATFTWPVFTLLFCTVSFVIGALLFLPMSLHFAHLYFYRYRIQLGNGLRGLWLEDGIRRR